MKKILVIDGNSILNRAFYGIRPLTTKDGLPTNAVYGIYSMITKNISALSPDYCAVAFDLKAPTFRHKMYDGYKATRHGMPEELAVQLPYAKECVRDMGLAVLELEGFEADDILGTLATSAASEGVSAYILTGDRDSLQLIDKNVTVLLATNKETVNFDNERFVSEYGISPSQFVDVKALMGDSSDNIPGVAGIGEKTALKLISEFGSLDALYESYEASSLTAGVKAKLSAGKDSAYMSRTLAAIEKNAPIGYSLENYKYDGINKSALKALFEKLEFYALIKKLSLDAPDASSDAPSSGESAGVSSESKAEAKLCAPQDFAVSDTVAVALSENGFSAYNGEQITSCELSEENIPFIERVLSSDKIIAHDAKKIYKELVQRSIKTNKIYVDTMLAAYCLNSTRKTYNLPEVYLGYMERSLADGTDAAIAAWELYGAMLPLIKEEKIEHLLFDIEMPLAYVLADMELLGVRVDVEGIRRYGEELSELADALRERIYYAAGEEFNIDSHKQLGEILFTKLGLPAYKKNKTGYSTDAEVLAKLRSKHEIVEDILDYRQVTKLISTYTEGLVKLADGKGRIHSIFSQTGTATGRLSSSDPNLQNIPVRTELGRKFRQFFIPKNEDYLIVDADYSQIELRLLAAISGDEAMILDFAHGKDIHTSTASRVFDVPLEDVTSELRKRAKAVNFGIVYGIGEYSLAEDLGISMVQAKKYIESYLCEYPDISRYLSEIKLSARADGYVTTLFGRRRYIPEINVSNKNVQHFGERVAMNSPIQGTAADIIKMAMVNTHARLAREGIDAKIILQVHDELLLEAHKDCAEQAMKILVEEMEGVVSLSVPMSVEAHIGKNWLEAK